MLSLIAKLLKLLNSDQNPSQLAIAICFAAALGLTPLSAPHNILVIFLLLIIRANLSMFLLAWGGFTLFAYAIDPISHHLGLALLQSDALHGLWQSLYNSNIWRFLAFNNSLILGSTLISLIISLPLFFISRSFIIKYREHVMRWVSQTRLGMWIKGGKLFGHYQSLRG